MKYRALILTGALFLLGAWEIGELLGVKSSAPVDADWQAATAYVDAGFKPGDLIVFAPDWVDPVGRKWLGHDMSVDMAARLDAARYATIWEVSIRGARAPESRGLHATAEKTFGAVKVRTLAHDAAPVSWDLVAKSKLLEVGFTPRMCDPIRAPGRVDAGDVPLGSELAIGAGLSDFRERKENHAVAALHVFVDDAEIGAMRVGDDSGWKLLRLPTQPGTHKLRFESSADGHGSPSLCIAAEARSPS
jgi:hypothetical protein